MEPTDYDPPLSDEALGWCRRYTILRRKVSEYGAEGINVAQLREAMPSLDKLDRYGKQHTD